MVPSKSMKINSHFVSVFLSFLRHSQNDIFSYIVPDVNCF